MDDSTDNGSAGPRPVRRDASLLLEASKLMQQWQADLAEQEQREERLAAREAEFENRRRDFDWWATRIRTELEEQRAVCQQQEAALARRVLLIDEQVQTLEQQAEALEVSQRAVEQLRAGVRAEIEQELVNEFARLEEIRRSLDAECAAFESSLTEFKSEHIAAESRFQQQMATEWAAFQEQMAAEWHEVSVLRERSQTAWAAFETQQLNRRAACEAEMHALREQTREELAAEQAAWCERQETLLAEWQRERVQFETRLRFQQDHLDKVRLDLETAQAEFRRERQLERQILAEDREQLERRITQVNRHRAALDEQAKSLDRERETLAKCRRAWDSTADADRHALRAERDAWEQERRRQELELQRQQATMISHAEALERKQSRLERLRSELEDTHRSTLELRLAVEESWAQIAHAVGHEEQAWVRVEQARQALVLYYQELHAGIAEQRRELLELQAQTDDQRMVFRDERQTLMHWLTQRDEQLRHEEERLRQQAEALAANEAAWQAARDQWLSEKLAAESLIRRLLAELGERETPTESLPFAA
jgi:hypothetical protein